MTQLVPSTKPVEIPYAAIGPALIANGYSAIPIHPTGKMPGAWAKGEWHIMRGWNRYCVELPGQLQVAQWSRWPGANVGVACGRGLLAFDIDRDDLVDPIRDVLPISRVAKRGRKGETLFYRGDTSLIRSRGFKIDGLGVMDLISDGKQTVLPPSIHPNTGEPYEWTTEASLADTPLDWLEEVTEEHLLAVIRVLEGHGYQAEDQSRYIKAATVPGHAIEVGDATSSGIADFYRTLNDDALGNLDAWIPRLGLGRLTRQGEGYRSVAEWRPSNSGHPLGKRPLLLSINPKGIVDYGDGDKGYTPLDLVMAAHDMAEWQLDKAAVWLGEAIGYDFSPTIVLNASRRDREEPQEPSPAPKCAERLSALPAARSRFPGDAEAMQAPNVVDVSCRFEAHGASEETLPENEAEGQSAVAVEARQITGAERAIGANRSMPEDDLLRIVRDVAWNTSAYPSDALCERLTRTSRHCTAYMQDAIRLSIMEARRDAGDYDDAAVERRVRKILAEKHALITGEPGLRERLAELAAAEMAPAGGFGPTPFKWQDPHNLPRRAWLYGTHLVRKELSATIAPGGGNKTSLCLVEALALASGRPLLGIAPAKRYRVWWWSGEEPFEELQRRILAACHHYGLSRNDIEGWLFVDNFESFDFVIAEQTRDGTKIFQPKVDLLTRWLANNAIDALFIDPAISTHNVGENDNVAIQKWATAWKDVAVGANAAISIAHHAKKLGGVAATADDSRGARSFVDKCRVVRSLNPMSKEEAERFGLLVEERRFYFSTDPTDAKANMAPAVGGKFWFRSHSVFLGAGRDGNLDVGESVGVVDRWKPPSMADKLDESCLEVLREEVGGRSWRAALITFNRPDSISAPIAAAFNLDLTTPLDLKRAKALYGRLKVQGVLVEEREPDDNYKPRPMARLAAP